MSSLAARSRRLEALVAERGLDLLLVTNLVNVRYLTGFSGTSGLCLIGGGTRVFATDFRYFDRVRRELDDYEVRRAKEELLKVVPEVLDELGREERPPRLGFDDAHLTVRAHAKLAELLGDRAELVPAGGLVEELRAVKDAEELAAMRQAAEIADEVYSWLVSEHGLAGHTERAVALAVEQKAKELGADELSFPPIIAAGANGALPHAVPRKVEIERDTLVVVDLGCVVEGYCSDCTRTLATGRLDDEAVDVYRLVQDAQAAALAAVRPGADVREVDAAARKLIDDAGRGRQFGHGTGHGVGLEVHEAPRIAQSAEGALVAGNSVTIEPGVYVPERLGVRIEDLVAVTGTGCEVLTATPKELLTVS